MAEPDLVRDCVQAMIDSVSIPVTVKHRIGIDRIERYDFVRDFIGTVARSGATTFIVHARNAWLEGISPKQNRELPPLRYEVVHALKRDFPQLRIVLNGGLTSIESANAQLAQLDGVMLGRAAYHDPWTLAGVDPVLFGQSAPVDDRFELIGPLQAYARRHVASGGRVRDVTRHVLGLFNGLPGARSWRRLLSDSGALAANDPALIAQAAGLVGAAGNRYARAA